MLKKQFEYYCSSFTLLSVAQMKGTFPKAIEAKG